MDWERYVLELTEGMDVSDMSGEFEKRLADFDFQAYGEDLLYNFLQPQLEQTWKRLRTNDAEVKQICRDAGLSDVEIAWQKYERARLTFRQLRRLWKLQDETTTLIDAELALWSLRRVILDHRPDLTVEMGELLMFETSNVSSSEQ